MHIVQTANFIDTSTVVYSGSVIIGGTAINNENVGCPLSEVRVCAVNHFGANEQLACNVTGITGIYVLFIFYHPNTTFQASFHSRSRLGSTSSSCSLIITIPSCKFHSQATLSSWASGILQWDQCPRQLDIILSAPRFPVLSLRTSPLSMSLLSSQVDFATAPWAMRNFLSRARNAALTYESSRSQHSEITSRFLHTNGQSQFAPSTLLISSSISRS